MTQIFVLRFLSLSSCRWFNSICLLQLDCFEFLEVFVEGALHSTAVGIALVKLNGNVNPNRWCILGMNESETNNRINEKLLF